MKIFFKNLTAAFLLISLGAVAQANQVIDNDNEPNFMDSQEYDPADPNIEAILQEYDRYYEQETGESPWLDDAQPDALFTPVGGCYRVSCQVFIHVKKSEQKAYLYVDGALVDRWLVSTGAQGHTTPNFDKNPNGRIYNKYSSSKFPGGDYNGLGNMPYAVFIEGGYALHGTPRDNWSKLGKRASHGCVRMHPENGKKFNQLVRQAGVAKTWITVD